MAIKRIILAITLVIVVSPGHAKSQMRYTCDAVRQMAEVNVGPELAVNILKDPATQTCRFFVSVAPKGKLKVVYDTWDEIKNTADAAKALAIVQEKFVPSAIEALTIPLSSADVTDDEKAQWMKTIMASSKEIETCSYETLWSKGSFYTGKDVSCGKIDTGEFLLEARRDTATLSVYLPSR